MVPHSVGVGEGTKWSVLCVCVCVLACMCVCVQHGGGGVGEGTKLNCSVCVCVCVQLYLGPNLSYETKGLTPATTYTFRVQVRCPRLPWDQLAWWSSGLQLYTSFSMDIFLLFIMC